MSSCHNNIHFRTFVNIGLFPQALNRNQSTTHKLKGGHEARERKQMISNDERKLALGNHCGCESVSSLMKRP